MDTGITRQIATPARDELTRKQEQAVAALMANPTLEACRRRQPHWNPGSLPRR